MYEFKYEIRLNDNGRPFIHLPEDYNHNVEDRFMALEIARYILFDLSKNKNNSLSGDFVVEIAKAGNIVGELSDRVADLIKGQMELLGTVKLNNPRHYDITKNSIEERDAIKYGNFIFGEKILERKEGFRVYVLSTQKIYELKGGIDNNHWIEVKEDAV